MDVDIINGENNRSGMPASLKALTEFYADFNGRDLEGSMKNWAHRDDVVMCNPIGGIRKGWDAIFEGYQRIMQGEIRVYVEFYDYQLMQCGNIFYAVGRERGVAQCSEPSSGPWSEPYGDKSGGQRLELAIRTSRVFQKIAGAWQQVHHHGSMDDPGLLNQYQNLINRVKNRS